MWIQCDHTGAETSGCEPGSKAIAEVIRAVDEFNTKSLNMDALNVDLMVEMEFLFQVELFPELMQEVEVVGTVALPEVPVAVEHR